MIVNADGCIAVDALVIPRLLTATDDTDGFFARKFMNVDMAVAIMAAKSMAYRIASENRRLAKYEAD